ncbi:MAG: prolyl oligopeptidase family serine peptidase [Streptomycetaceae bacterium]|nr:prolyl oligopeptidase family serine peptidase [Streptomycetaceae bacterium]
MADLEIKTPGGGDTGVAVVRRTVADGTALFAVDPGNAGRERQLTPDGAQVMHYEVEPGGAAVWWFKAQGGTETGRWVRQRLDEPPSAAAPVRYMPEGIGVGGFQTTGRVTIAGVAVGDDTHLYRIDATLQASPIGTYLGGMSMVNALSADGRYAAVAYVAEGDVFNKHLHVRDVVTGHVVLQLPAVRWAHFRRAEFSPVPGDRRLLHEDRSAGGRIGLSVVDVVTGESVRVTDPEPARADLTGSWLPAGNDAEGKPIPPRRLLVTAHREGRTAVYLHDLGDRSTRRVRLPDGLGVEDRLVTGTPVPTTNLTVLDDNRVLLAVSGPRHRRGFVALDTRTGEVGPGAPWQGPTPVDGAVDRRYGTTKTTRGHGADTLRVPYSVSVPKGPRPQAGWPSVFMIHGGPFSHDTDVFNADEHELNADGFAVVRVNYSGSTGQGLDAIAIGQRDAIMGQLADIASVQEHLADRGVVDRGRCGIMGNSWGGTLALSAGIHQPQRWRSVVAKVPAVDPHGLVRDEGIWPSVKRSIAQTYFRGRGLSGTWPLSNAHKLQVPTLVIGGRDDIRSPLGHIEAFVDKARRAGRDIRLWVMGGGHTEQANGGAAIAQQISRRTRAFFATTLRAGPHDRMKPPGFARGAQACAPPLAPSAAGRGHRSDGSRSLDKSFSL